MTPTEFKGWVGRLLHVARVARPDILYQTVALERVSNYPSEDNVLALTHLIKYLSTTKHHGVCLRRPENMQVSGFSDATWSPEYGDQFDNYRSTSGWLFQLGNDYRPALTNGLRPEHPPASVLSWSSRQQPIVARSSSESELFAASDAAIEAIHIRKLMNFMGNYSRSPVDLFVDNQTAVRQSVNTMDMRNCRHTGRHAAWLRQRCKYGDINLHYVPGDQQRADFLTKVQFTPAHRESCRAINLVPMNASITQGS